MSWRVEIKDSAKKEIKKLDKSAQAVVVRFLRERVAGTENLRRTGKALKGELGELWRYRVGDYRIICEIKEDVVTVLVLRVGHRREVYRR